MTEILLVDLSAIFWACWHSSVNDEVSAARNRTLAQIRRLADGRDYVAICCDEGTSFRKAIYPDYKANRPEKDKAALDELRQTKERLVADGMLLWGASGFEADDVIATATMIALDQEHVDSVTIATADKDLTQLVADRVTIASTRSGDALDREKVKEKFGVYPELMGQFLALVGDKSDNVPGVAKVGEKTAANLLNHYGSIEKIRDAVCSDVADLPYLTPAIRGSLLNSGASLDLSLKLVTLRTDAPIAFAEIFAKRPERAFTRTETDALRRASESIEEELASAEDEIVAEIREDDAGGAGEPTPDTVAPDQRIAAQRPRLSVAAIVATMRDLKMIRTFIKTQLKEGIKGDFGVIPGVDRKTLFLPGGQKIGAFFNVRPSYAVEITQLPNGHVEYLTHCDLVYRPTGEVVSSGLGSCSTMETKYRFRSGEAEVTSRPVPKEYWDNRDPKLLGGKEFTAKKVDGRWFIAKKSTERVENDNIHDVRNTVLKMSKKRSFIDSIMALGCISDLFTQDIGDTYDIDEEVLKHLGYQ